MQGGRFKLLRARDTGSIRLPKRTTQPTCYSAHGSADSLRTSDHSLCKPYASTIGWGLDFVGTLLLRPIPVLECRDFSHGGRHSDHPRSSWPSGGSAIRGDAIPSPACSYSIGSSTLASKNCHVIFFWIRFAPRAQVLNNRKSPTSPEASLHSDLLVFDRGFRIVAFELHPWGQMWAEAHWNSSVKTTGR